MPSKTEIANRTLGKLGSPHINDLREADPGAKAILSGWDMIRRDELVKNVWTFSKTQKNLAASTAVPLFKWSYAYPRAANDLRLVEIGASWVSSLGAQFYDIQGRMVLTNVGSPLSVSYVRDVTNTGEFSPEFAECLAARGALEHCMLITGSNSLLGSMEAWYSKTIEGARRTNAIQLPPQQIGGREPWVESRRMSGTPWRADDIWWG